ncbi:hypothetical protein EHR04_09455 [Leptospira levettii]|uniref:hypothetical protein n=1 Tax=Leptospira levettii TaxID=2023178 RepID=UPI000C2AB90A|nr:hypothetical protein [Leptospira levettii]PKA27167.1 hypothetical protein CH381_06780 [Leptospira sp. mixed culture ATI2-C-A1]TGM75781.1 hypothetical protein EHR04_09455 [Leptospira levettii]
MSIVSLKMNVYVNKDKKIEIQLPNDISEGDHELVLVIDSIPKKNAKPLSDYIGKINWSTDGLEYQNQMRSEWK